LLEPRLTVGQRYRPRSESATSHALRHCVIARKVRKLCEVYATPYSCNSPGGVVPGCVGKTQANGIRPAIVLLLS